MLAKIWNELERCADSKEKESNFFFSYGQKMEWIKNIGTKSKNRKLIENKLVKKKWLVGRKQWYGKEWWGDQESRN